MKLADTRIVGIGESRCGKVPERSALQLLVAVVALDEGPHMMTLLTQVQPDAVRIGMRVRISFETQDEEITLPVFCPEGQS